MKYCQKCGKALMDGAAFCPGCGSSVGGAVPVGSTVPVTTEAYEEAVSCSLVCVIVSAVLLLTAAAVWWFVSMWLGVILCLAAELVAVVPNTKVQNLFKKNNRHITDKKQRKAKEKALRKELGKRNAAYRFSFIFAAICFVFLIGFVFLI